MHKGFLSLFMALLVSTLTDLSYGSTQSAGPWKKLVSDKKELLEKIVHLEQKHHECGQKKEERKEKLSQQRKKIMTCLPLLLRLGRANSFQLLVDLKSTENSIRGLILMRAFLASLRQHVQRIQAELNELRAVEKDLSIQQDECKTLLTKIALKQSDLQTKGRQAIEDIQNKEEARLSGETDIGTLLEESRAILLKTDTKKPKPSLKQDLPFRILESPVNGKRVKEKDLQKRFSTHKLGLLYKTGKGAVVRAAAKGTVAFKGPFRSQGDILILDHGQDVHTVYMGIEKISVEMGQPVYAGEMIGTMAGHGKEAPLLYMELRQKGKPIDPAPYGEDM